MLINIKNANPAPDDSFFVDTNVWFWFTYAASKSFDNIDAKGYQETYYPEFIEKALNCGSKLHYSSLTLPEIAHAIERTELDIYNRYHPDATIGVKRFRKIPEERSVVIKEITTAWNTIKSMATEIPLSDGVNLSGSILSSLTQFTLDGYDAIYYVQMQENNLTNIITDDKDFKTIPDLKMYGTYG